MSYKYNQNGRSHMMEQENVHISGASSKDKNHPTINVCNESDNQTVRRDFRREGSNAGSDANSSVNSGVFTKFKFSSRPKLGQNRNSDFSDGPKFYQFKFNASTKYGSSRGLLLGNSKCGVHQEYENKSRMSYFGNVSLNSSQHRSRDNSPNSLSSSNGSFENLYINNDQMNKPFQIFLENTNESEQYVKFAFFNKPRLNSQPLLHGAKGSKRLGNSLSPIVNYHQYSNERQSSFSPRKSHQHENESPRKSLSPHIISYQNETEKVRKLSSLSSTRDNYYSGKEFDEMNDLYSSPSLSEVDKAREQRASFDNASELNMRKKKLRSDTDNNKNKLHQSVKVHEGDKLNEVNKRAKGQNNICSNNSKSINKNVMVTRRLARAIKDRINYFDVSDSKESSPSPKRKLNSRTSRTIPKKHITKQLRSPQKENVKPNKISYEEDSIEMMPTLQPIVTLYRDPVVESYIGHSGNGTPLLSSTPIKNKSAINSACLNRKNIMPDTRSVASVHESTKLPTISSIHKEKAYSLRSMTPKKNGKYKSYNVTQNHDNIVRSTSVSELLPSVTENENERVKSLSPPKTNSNNQEPLLIQHLADDNSNPYYSLAENDVQYPNPTEVNSGDVDSMPFPVLEEVDIKPFVSASEDIGGMDFHIKDAFEFNEIKISKMEPLHIKMLEEMLENEEILSPIKTVSVDDSVSSERTNAHPVSSVQTNNVFSKQPDNDHVLSEQTDDEYTSSEQSDDEFMSTHQTDDDYVSSELVDGPLFASFSSQEDADCCSFEGFEKSNVISESRQEIKQSFIVNKVISPSSSRKPHPNLPLPPIAPSSRELRKRLRTELKKAKETVSPIPQQYNVSKHGRLRKFTDKYKSYTSRKSRSPQNDQSPLDEKYKKKLRKRMNRKSPTKYNHETANEIVYIEKILVDKCLVCDFLFEDHNTLHSHMKTHRTSFGYFCPHCKFSSLILCDYINHLKIHLTEKLYICDICSFKCKEKSSFLPHKASHLGWQL